ncbi:MAG: riboflavin biosynthesis protein RibF [Clostridia bacterium]|nr:riboflavin biosynthesis protein RibF [Clostridia bacterium]
MLKTVWLTDNKKNSQGVAMLLGGFDGLHVGHRSLLARAKESGLPVGMMTIAGCKDKGVFTFAERELIFKESGADFVFELPFEEIKALSPESFLKLLQENFAPALFVCGEDFRFGENAQGTPKTIQQWGQVCVEVVPLLEIEGEKVSSRTVKSHLAEGNVAKANALLGERFFLLGEVIKDRQVGRTMGFPTANILYPQEKFPLKQGVYETCVTVDGVRYKGITNYGARPTFDNACVLTETYLDGFHGDLYGKALKVEFVRFLREITRFADIQALKQQLETDIWRVRNND